MEFWAWWNEICFYGVAENKKCKIRSSPAFTNTAIIILTFFLRIYIHRRAAEYAENPFFMFAVERPANIKTNPSEKNELPMSCGKKTKHLNSCPKGLGLFLFGFSTKRNEKNTLCALCASSEAGGESKPKH